MAPDRVAAWRFAATNTHLYRGARLSLLDPDANGAVMPGRGDAVAIEFADLRAATGIIVAATNAAITVAISAHGTAAGTAIGPKAWVFTWDSATGPAGGVKVAARIK